MVVPSGLHAGRPPSSPVYVVSCRGVAPAFASMTKTLLSWLRSGSGPRLLTNAICVPSGDHEGLRSS